MSGSWKVAALASGAGVERGPEYYAVLLLGLVATVAVTAVVTRLARRALSEATGESESPPDDPVVEHVPS